MQKLFCYPPYPSPNSMIMMMMEKHDTTNAIRAENVNVYTNNIHTFITYIQHNDQVEGGGRKLLM